MRKLSLGVFVFFVLSVILYVGCSKQESMVVAKVGREKITWGEFREGYLKSPQYRRAKDDSAAKREYLDSVIQKRLIIQEAYKLGLDEEEQILKQLEKTEKGLILQSLYTKEIVEKIVDDSEIREFYNHSDKEVQARHILIKAPPNASPEERQKARSKIDSLLVVIKDKGEDFAKVAKENSEDPTTMRDGGDLGFFAWGIMADEFQQVAFALQPGQISDVVETKFGYHIIKVEGNRKAERKSYDEMKESIRNKIVGRKKSELRQKADEYIVTLKQDNNLTFENQALVFLSEKKKEAEFSAEKLTADEKSTVLARYKGGEFTVADFLEWEKEIPAKARERATDPGSLQRHVEGKLVNDFLVAKAKALNLDNEPHIKQKIQEQKEELMAKEYNKSIEATVQITDDDVKTHFEQNKEEYVEPEKVNIREILVKEKTVAENLLKRIKNGADMASLAKQYSERKWAAERGGEFGLFTINQYGPIGEEAFALKKGEFGGPIQVTSGYSIFKVIDRQASHPKKFEEVESTIKRDLETERKKAAFAEATTALREKADVDINLQILTMSVDEEQPGGGEQS